jgi:hypothetical protein
VPPIMLSMLSLLQVEGGDCFQWWSMPSMYVARSCGIDEGWAIVASVTVAELQLQLGCSCCVYLPLEVRKQHAPRHGTAHHRLAVFCAAEPADSCSCAVVLLLCRRHCRNRNAASWIGALSFGCYITARSKLAAWHGGEVVGDSAHEWSKRHARPWARHVAH